MRWHIYKVRRKPGFRLNLIDILILGLVALLSWFGRDVFSGHHLYLIPAYLGVSFFSFCNVFRIGNNLEAIWYIPFLAFTLYGLTRPEIYWLLVFGIFEPLRIALIAYRIRKGNYVGVFYKQVQRLQKEPCS